MPQKGSETMSNAACLQDPEPAAHVLVASRMRNIGLEYGLKMLCLFGTGFCG